MLKLRVLTAVVGIPLFLALLFAPGGNLFCGTICLLVLVGLWEYWSAHTAGLRDQNVQPNAIATFLGLLFPLAAWVAESPLASHHALQIKDYACNLWWILGLGLAFLWEIWLCWQSGLRPIAINLGVGLLGAFYVGWLFSFVILLRLTPGTQIWFGYTVDRGAVILLWLMVTLWVGDSAAYFVGHAVGKRKMAPLLSPGKTVEGAMANLLGCLLVSLGMSLWLGFSLWQGLLVGAGVGILGQIGDLFKSALKRWLGIKDFDRLLPGHGGVLDRFDSLLFTAVWMFHVVGVTPSGS